MELITIDVSELQPPEPMTEILRSLSNLAKLQCLKVIHSREPFPLYKKLSESGWSHFCQLLPASNVEFKQCHIFIYKQSESTHFEAHFQHLINSKSP